MEGEGGGFDWLLIAKSKELVKFATFLKKSTYIQVQSRSRIALCHVLRLRINEMDTHVTKRKE
jgi:hypothetical protein